MPLERHQIKPRAIDAADAPEDIPLQTPVLEKSVGVASLPSVPAAAAMRSMKATATLKFQYPNPKPNEVVTSTLLVTLPLDSEEDVVQIVNHVLDHLVPKVQSTLLKKAELSDDRSFGGFGSLPPILHLVRIGGQTGRARVTPQPLSLAELASMLRGEQSTSQDYEFLVATDSSDDLIVHPGCTPRVKPATLSLAGHDLPLAELPNRAELVKLRNNVPPVPEQLTEQMRTMSCYNTASQRVLLAAAQSAKPPLQSEDDTPDGSSALTDALSIRPKPVITRIIEMQRELDKGGLNIDEYRENVERLLRNEIVISSSESFNSTRRAEKLADEVAVLHPQLYAGMDPRDLVAVAEDPQAILHRHLHTLHVLPVIRSLQQGGLTLKNHMNTSGISTDVGAGRETVVRATYTEICTWKAFATAIKTVHEEQPQLFGQSLIALISCLYSSLYLELKPLLDAHPLTSVLGSSSSYADLMSDASRVLCAVLKDELAPWAAEADSRTKNLISAARRHAKMMFHKSTCITYKSIDRLWSAIIDILQGTHVSLDTLRTFMKKFLHKLAPAHPGLIYNLIQDIAGAIEESHLAKTDPPAVSIPLHTAEPVCVTCGESIEMLSLVRLYPVLECLHFQCFLEADPETVQGFAPVVWSRSETLAPSCHEGSVASTHLLAHHKNMLESVIGTRTAVLPDNRKAIITTQVTGFQTSVGEGCVSRPVTAGPAFTVAPGRAAADPEVTSSPRSGTGYVVEAVQRVESVEPEGPPTFREEPEEHFAQQGKLDMPTNSGGIDEFESTAEVPLSGSIKDAVAGSSSTSSSSSSASDEPPQTFMRPESDTRNLLVNETEERETSAARLGMDQIPECISAATDQFAGQVDSASESSKSSAKKQLASSSENPSVSQPISGSQEETRSLGGVVEQKLSHRASSENSEAHASLSVSDKSMSSRSESDDLQSESSDSLSEKSAADNSEVEQRVASNGEEKSRQDEASIHITDAKTNFGLSVPEAAAVPEPPASSSKSDSSATSLSEASSTSAENLEAVAPSTSGPKIDIGERSIPPQASAAAVPEPPTSSSKSDSEATSLSETSSTSAENLEAAAPRTSGPKIDIGERSIPPQASAAAVPEPPASSSKSDSSATSLSETSSASAENLEAAAPRTSGQKIDIGERSIPPQASAVAVESQVGKSTSSSLSGNDRADMGESGKSETPSTSQITAEKLRDEPPGTALQDQPIRHQSSESSSSMSMSNSESQSSSSATAQEVPMPTERVDAGKDMVSIMQKALRHDGGAAPGLYSFTESVASLPTASSGANCGIQMYPAQSAPQPHSRQSPRQDSAVPPPAAKAAPKAASSPEGRNRFTTPRQNTPSYAQPLRTQQAQPKKTSMPSKSERFDPVASKGQGIGSNSVQRRVTAPRDSGSQNSPRNLNYSAPQNQQGSSPRAGNAAGGRAAAMAYNQRPPSSGMSSDWTSAPAQSPRGPSTDLAAGSPRRPPATQARPPVSARGVNSSGGIPVNSRQLPIIGSSIGTGGSGSSSYRLNKPDEYGESTAGVPPPEVGGRIAASTDAGVTRTQSQPGRPGEQGNINAPWRASPRNAPKAAQDRKPVAATAVPSFAAPLRSTQPRRR